MLRSFVLGVCLLSLAGCATRSAQAADPRPNWGQTVAASAEWHLKNRPRLARNDCSGLVQAILTKAGHSVTGNSRTMWYSAKARGRLIENPRPGDLAFFDYTYDANRNGKVDDLLTHVAVVVRVDEDGTVHMVHRGGKGILPLRVNRAAPNKHKRSGKVVNDYIRKRGYGKKNAPRLTGQLLRGFARPPRPAAKAHASVVPPETGHVRRWQDRASRFDAHPRAMQSAR